MSVDPPNEEKVWDKLEGCILFSKVLEKPNLFRECNQSYAF